MRVPTAPQTRRRQRAYSQREGMMLYTDTPLDHQRPYTMASTLASLTTRPPH
jgi:hypothetical protein